MMSSTESKFDVSSDAVADPGGGSLGSDEPPPLRADSGVVVENARTGVTKRHFTEAVHSLIWQHEYIEG